MVKLKLMTTVTATGNNVDDYHDYHGLVDFTTKIMNNLCKSTFYRLRIRQPLGVFHFVLHSILLLSLFCVHVTVMTLNSAVKLAYIHNNSDTVYCARDLICYVS